DALGPGVPAGDPALAIEHVNRVVAHALHQHAEALFALAQALLALAPVRKVARDLAESAHRARLVAQRRDHHVRPEARAVLAPPPALVLVAPLGRRDAQLRGRHAARILVWRIEDGKVLPENLAFLVALQPLGPGAPGDDAAIGIEQEDRVVANALDDAPVGIFDARKQLCWSRVRHAGAPR